MENDYSIVKLKRIIESIVSELSDEVNGLNVEDIVPKNRLISWVKEYVEPHEVYGLDTLIDEVFNYLIDKYKPKFLDCLRDSFDIGDIFSKEEVISWCKENLKSEDLQ
jgi:hypothetical protein